MNVAGGSSTMPHQASHEDPGPQHAATAMDLSCSESADDLHTSFDSPNRPFVSGSMVYHQGSYDPPIALEVRFRRALDSLPSEERQITMENSGPRLPYPDFFSDTADDGVPTSAPSGCCDQRFHKFGGE